MNRNITHQQRRIVGLLGNNIIDEVGQYDAKYNTTVSQASHFLDVTMLAVNAYLYDVDKNGMELDEEQLDVLACGLALHDVDKTINQKRDEIEFHHVTDEDREDDGRIMESSTRVLQEYFKRDWFGIEDFLSRHSENPVDEYFDTLYYLIKRTEKRDNIEDLPQVAPKFRRLTRYCELADTTVSVMTNKTDIDDGFQKLKPYFDDGELHKIELTKLELPVLHFTILDSVKNHIQQQGNFVLGNTPSGLIYLGDAVDKEEIIEPVRKLTAERIRTEFNVSCKTNHQTVNYNALPVLDLPIASKKDIIRDEYMESVIKADSCGTPVIESVPDEFVEILPEALHMLYHGKHYEYDDENLQETMDEIQENNYGTKYKILLIHEVLQNYDELGEAFIAEARQWKDELVEALEPVGNPLEDAIETVLQLDVSVEVVPPATETCLLCGQRAVDEYNGNTIYRTHSYSRRTGFEQKYKKICPVCRMEHALMDSVIADSKAYGDKIEMVYFYFDSFSASIGYEETASKMTADILDGKVAFDDDRDGFGAVSLYSPLVHFQPVTLESNGSERQAKLETVKDILKRVQDTGMKARVSTPFRPFDLTDSVFKDTNPIEQQKLLDATDVERYEDINRLVTLFELGDLFATETNDSFSYKHIIPPTAENLIHNTVVKISNTPTTVTHLGEYVSNYCKMSDMTRLADLGYKLFGEQYSKHAKQKVIRESLNALVDSRSNNLSDEQLTDEVAGACLRASRTYHTHAQADHAEQFAQQLIEYAEQFDIGELTKKQNQIADTFLYAYETNLDEQTDG
jgi:hypothetical protein